MDEKMNWIPVDSEEKLDEIKKLSAGKRVLLLKYTPEQTVNSLVRMVLEREWNPKEMNMDVFLLDVDEYPVLSEKATVDFNIPHDTPQALIVENGKCVFSANHGKIDFRTLREFANKKNSK
ncbi:MAG TPA: monothiol bacilliredoxin BrxC family protein [Ignavibacteria bacterium]